MKYGKLLLSELRFVTYERSDAGLTDQLMAKAVTLNENLKSLGYTLCPADIAAIAVSPSLDGFYDRIRHLTDKVTARPMYPGFPQQVMEMSEAMFRFHQMVHYFSTYHMEALFGVNVTKGWLPCEDGADAVPADQELILPEKTIRLLPVEDSYIVPLRLILTRKERMTLPERSIVSAAISHVSAEQVSTLKVGFKENMNALYEIVFNIAADQLGVIFYRQLS